MKIIAVKKLFSNAFSEKNALILRSEIQKLLNTKEKILIDFEGISKYTTLFFNFSTGYFISLLGVEKYNEKISLKGLSSLGKRTYQNSYKNAIKSYPPEIQKEILRHPFLFSKGGLIYAHNTYNFSQLRICRIKSRK